MKKTKGKYCPIGKEINVKLRTGEDTYPISIKCHPFSKPEVCAAKIIDKELGFGVMDGISAEASDATLKARIEFWLMTLIVHMERQKKKRISKKRQKKWKEALAESIAEELAKKLESTA